MRHLIGSFDPSVWMIVSASVFFLAFVVLIVWVYLPSRKKYYEQKGKLPLGEEQSYERSKK
jgi:cbb3-type cytochrome oxidase subunit 3